MSFKKVHPTGYQHSPLKEVGFSMNKLEFRDAIALRYDLSVPRLPDICACGNEFTRNHAMICNTGGFVSL